MVKNSERRSRSVLAVRRPTSSDFGSKTNEENYSAPHPPPPSSPSPLRLPPPSKVSFSEESDRRNEEALRITLDANRIERFLKVAQQALSSRRRDGVDGGGGGSEEIPRRTTAAHHPHEVPRSDDSLRSTRICRDNETKLLSNAEEFQTRNPTTRVGVKSPSPSPSIHAVFFSHDPRNEREANVADSESRGFQNTDAIRHPNDSVVSQTAAAGAMSFGVTSNAASEHIDPRRNDGPADILCRGYSNQRRHGRKASLGTTDITRLIPTLVSENEEFRDREYQRKISLPTFDGAAHNLTI